MAILNFQKPDKVIMIDSTDYEGKFEFRPLEPGYGLTVGNALRRVLLSSLEGFAITSVKIEGVDHEFSTISWYCKHLLNHYCSLFLIKYILDIYQKVKNINKIRNENSKKLQAKGEEPLDRYEFDYLLLCNKICGKSHYNMQMKIIVETEEEYNEWISEQKQFKNSLVQN